MTNARVMQVATSLNSALANYDNFVNDLVFSLVTEGNTSGTSNTFTFTKTIPRTNQYVDGMTCKLMFTSALQSSVAIDEVLIKVNNLEAKPIKVMRNNTLVNMTSSEMQSGAEYSSTYKHRWCDAYTKLELTYSSSANAWIANADDVVMSYVSTDSSSYKKVSNGLIGQSITTDAMDDRFDFLLCFKDTNYTYPNRIRNISGVAATIFYKYTNYCTKDNVSHNIGTDYNYFEGY